MKNEKKKRKIFIMLKIGIVIVIAIIFAEFLGLFWKNTIINNGILNRDDKTNGPAAIEAFTNSVTIDEKGNITYVKSIQELWNELKRNGNDIVTELNSSEELAKLLNAQTVTQYPDTRPSKDDGVKKKNAPNGYLEDAIDWEKINKDVNSDKVQGMVKLERAYTDGTKRYLSYVTPKQMDEWIDTYNDESKSDKERKKARDNAMKHYTLEKGKKESSSTEGSGTGGTLDGNQLKIYKVLSAGGLTDLQIAAILGNIDRESGTNPEAVSPAGYRGLIQWSTTRWAGLESYAKSKNASPTDITIQSEYILKELFKGDAGAWGGNNPSKNRDAFLKATTVHEATKIFLVTTEMGRDYNGESDETVQSWYPDWDLARGYNSAEEAYKKMQQGGNNDSSGTSGTLTSLKKVLFIGDSILGTLESSLKAEGATVLYQESASADFFLGKANKPSGNGNCKLSGSKFDWSGNLSGLNPTAAYIILGQNSIGNTKDIKKLVENLQKEYSNIPIYINSVVPAGSAYTWGGMTKQQYNSGAKSMNTELKNYCSGNNNVYYSDVLDGYSSNVDQNTRDGLHPNSAGVSVLVENIKKNITGSSESSTSQNSSTDTNNTSSTSSSSSTYSSDDVTGNDILNKALKYVDVLEYAENGNSLKKGVDNKGFVYAILKSLKCVSSRNEVEIAGRSIGTDSNALAENGQPGDIIIYKNKIGIYDGTGGYVSGPSKKGGKVKLKNDAESGKIIDIRRFGKDLDNSSSTAATKKLGELTPQTQAIIDKHKYDFDETNFTDRLNNKYGGYENYLKEHLGGVFAKYAGKNKKIKVKTAADFQEATEYVYGLMMIYGFDYGNNRRVDKWRGDDRFYTISSSIGYSGGSIDDICAGKTSEGMRSCCNIALNTLFDKIGAKRSSRIVGSRVNDYPVITKLEDLQVGDVVQFFHTDQDKSKPRSTWNGNQWHHVAIVGEVDKAKRKICFI